MINANELRIGNWVKAHGSLKKMTGVLLFEMEMEKGEHDKFYDPIPLTPDILEKAGFKKDRNYWKIDDPINNEINKTTYLFRGGIFLIREEINMTGETFDLVSLSAKLTALHQLQNLYFALTGQELNVTL